MVILQKNVRKKNLLINRIRKKIWSKKSAKKFADCPQKFCGHCGLFSCVYKNNFIESAKQV